MMSLDEMNVSRESFHNTSVSLSLVDVKFAKSRLHNFQLEISCKNFMIKVTMMLQLATRVFN
jgi:hypothetical protein